jgi:transposase
LAELQGALHEEARLSRGRLPCPSVVILDSQSLKTTERGGTRGFDGHKRVKGRKRHLLVDTLGMVVARRVEAANVSDRRVGARLLAGLQSGFPWIRTVMADAGYESRKLACELKRRHGWRLHITKRRQRAFKVVGLTWNRGAHVCVAGQKSSLEQRLRVEGPHFGSLHRPGGHPPHAQTARPEVGRPAAYSVWQIFGADE